MGFQGLEKTSKTMGDNKKKAELNLLTHGDTQPGLACAKYSHVSNVCFWLWQEVLNCTDSLESQLDYVWGHTIHNKLGFIILIEMYL